MKSKNKKILICISTFILVLLSFVSLKQFITPEDNSLSSGDAVYRRLTKHINNYSNVDNYKYGQKAESNNSIFLNEVPYHFMDNITFDYNEYLQGICFTNQYMLVSAYKESDDDLGAIKVYSLDSKIHLVTLAMDGESHLGGITFDGENIWVCNSSKNGIERLPESTLDQIVANHFNEVVDVRNLVELYEVQNTPSCITYCNNRLWVATHNKDTTSTMIAYHYTDTFDRLLKLSSHYIPSKVQGLVFDEDNRLYLSMSYGRKNSSYLVRYDSLAELDRNIYAYDLKIEMPPCSEGIAISEDELYILFESAGEKYLEGTDGNGRSRSPLDRILVISLEDL